MARREIEVSAQHFDHVWHLDYTETQNDPFQPPFLDQGLYVFYNNPSPVNQK